MPEYFQIMSGDLFQTVGFMPHIHCYLDRPALVWTMFASDLLIGLAYVGISLTLWSLVRKVRIAFSLVILCFGVFIGACGLTHFLEVWTLWHPDYWVAAGVKVLTAIASVGTGAYLFKLRHALADLAEVAKTSDQQRLELANLNASLERIVTERTSAALESERKLAELADNLKGHVFHIMDFDPPQLSYVSPAFEAIWGLPLSILKEDPHAFLRGVHPDDRALLQAAMEEQYRGKDSQIIFRVVRPDGSIRWIEDRAQIVFDPEGKPIRATGYAEDITERRLLQERFERTAKATKIGIWYCDLPFADLIWDKTVKEHFWLPPDAHVTIETFYERIHAEDREKTRQAIAHSVEQNTPYDILYRTIHPEVLEKFKWIRAVGWTDYDALQKPIRFDGVTFDVTEQLRYEMELKDALRARDEFLSIASHELKTPLTSLRLQTQLLNRQIAKNDPDAYRKPRVDQLAEQTDKQTLRLVRLVDDMLDIARIRSGKLTIQPEPFDLCELVQDTVKRMHSQFVDAGCGDPKLVLCEPVHGEWDRMRMEQVLDNLFTNAIRYGRGQPVEVSVERFNQHIRLSVKDHGIGISPEAQPKIFDRFERAVDANEISGLGLGLFIARQIVLAHGGTLGVQSELGQGSTFSIELPFRTPRIPEQMGIHVG